MGQLLENRRAETGRRLNDLAAELTRAEGLATGKACVYLTGSFGRGEASAHSDLDLFVVGRADGLRPLLSRLDEICLKAELIEGARKLGFPEFSGDGEYLQHYTVAKLIASLGTPQDDATNTFTARLLLLLESRSLIGDDIYSEAIDEVLARYWREFDNHRKDFVPAFLANDILRLWRTLCVNYEARTDRETEEKRAKQKLKNYKLKHSRLLTCYSGLIFLLATFVEKGTVTPMDAKAMVRLSPTQRLEWLVRRSRFESCSATILDLLERYEEFLSYTNASEETLVDGLRVRESRRKLQEDIWKFGDLIWRLLQQVGGENPMLRMLAV